MPPGSTALSSQSTENSFHGRGYIFKKNAQKCSFKNLFISRLLSIEPQSRQLTSASLLPFEKGARPTKFRALSIKGVYGNCQGSGSHVRGGYRMSSKMYCQLCSFLAPLRTEFGPSFEQN